MCILEMCLFCIIFFFNIKNSLINTYNKLRYDLQKQSCHLKITGFIILERKLCLSLLSFTYDLNF